MSDVTSLTGPFAAAAAAAGLQPPLRLVEHDARGWALLDRDDETLLVDEFGELWWTRVGRFGDARVIRPLWPEERRSLFDLVADALERIRPRAISSR